MGVTGQREQGGVKRRTPPRPLSHRSGRQHPRFFSYWVTKHLLLVNIFEGLHFVSYKLRTFLASL